MSILYQNNFDAEATGALPAGWAAISGTWAVGTTQVVSGTKSFGSTSNVDGDLILYKGVSASDQVITFSQRMVLAGNGFTNTLYAGLRFDATGQNGYLLAVESSSSNTITLYKRNAGAYSSVASAAYTPSWAANDVVNYEARAVGSTFELRVWNATASQTRPVTATFSATDTTFTAAGYPGFYRAGVNQAAIALDDFVYSDVAAAPAGVTFNVTDANVFFSPYNWYSNGAGAMQANNVKALSTFAWSNMRGAYLKFKATVTANGTIGLTIDTATLSNIAAAGCPTIAWSINGAATQTQILATGQTSISLANGLAAGTYEVFVWFQSVYITQDGGTAQNYTAVNNRFHVTAINLSAGGTVSPATLKSKRMIVYGDSITEGDLSNGGPRSASSQDALLAYGWYLAETLDAEVGIVGFYGQTWAWFDSTWLNYASGLSRLSAGLLTPAPDYISVNYGENDGNPGPAAATVTATLANVATAAPNAKIISIIPFSGKARTNLAAATLPVNGVRVDLARYELLPGNTQWSYDGQHPNARGHANLGSLLSAAVTAGGVKTLRTITLTLTDRAGAALPNLTGIKWSINDITSVGTQKVIADSGTGATTNAAGVITLSVNTTVAANRNIWLVLTNGAGTPSTVDRFYNGPVVVV